MADMADILVYLQEDVPLPQLGRRGRLNEQTNYKVLPRCTVGSRQYPYIGERERDKPIGEEGDCKPKELIRGGQGLAKG